MCIRFHDECCTLQAEDSLWIFVKTVANNNKENDETTLYPIGRYSGAQDWPETVVLVPGNTLWFVLETSNVIIEEMDPTKVIFSFDIEKFYY